VYVYMCDVLCSVCVYVCVMCGQCVCVRVCDVHDLYVCWEKYQYTAKDTA